LDSHLHDAGSKLRGIIRLNSGHAWRDQFPVLWSNGLPSLFPRVPLALPYWNHETYRSILHCLITGNVIGGAEHAKLRSQIVETIGVAKLLLCGSGSLALELALRACGVAHGDEVVLPSLCCTAVVPPILAVGATPVLADAGDELNITAATVEAVLTAKAKAVIVPHLFGNPAEIDAIIELVHGRNIRVIDDAAQALGATIGGQAVGSFGDVGVLSFGNEKICFGLGGGVLLSRREHVLDGSSAIQLSQPKFAATIRKLFSTIIFRSWRRWTYPALAALSRVKTTNPDSPPAPSRAEAMANLNAAVALSLMQTLHNNITARRARVRAYHELLDDAVSLQLIPHRAGSACLSQVIRVLPKRRGTELASDLIERLGDAGYEVQGSYVPMHLLSHFDRCVWDRLPFTERVWADLVELPCEPTVSLDDVRDIASLVKKSLA